MTFGNSRNLTCQSKIPLVCMLALFVNKFIDGLFPHRIIKQSFTRFIRTHRFGKSVLDFGSSGIRDYRNTDVRTHAANAELINRQLTEADFVDFSFCRRNNGCSPKRDTCTIPCCTPFTQPLHMGESASRDATRIHCCNLAHLLWCSCGVKSIISVVR